MKKTTIALAALLMFAAFAHAKKNVVLIMTDDLNDYIGAYGHPVVQTPNIDQLAAKGVRFDNAYVTASSCSPSRNSIITGRYPHNTGAPELHMDLPEGQFMFPQSLKDAGYYSVLSGKWHMGEATRPAFDEMTPERHDRKTYDRLYLGARPPIGTVSGQQAGAEQLN